MATRSTPTDKDAKLAQLETAYRALQDQVIRTNQLVDTVGGMIQELKSGKPRAKRVTKDWSHVKEW